MASQPRSQSGVDPGNEVDGIWEREWWLSCSNHATVGPELSNPVQQKMFMVRYLNVPYRLGARAFSTSFERKSKQNFQFVVVGGGSGGLSISATLCRKYPHATAIIEPSEVR